MSPNDTLTAIPGLKVGHATDLVGATGCTVVLCPSGTIAGVDQRGGAPGTRETDLLHPMHLVNEIHAILLTGGSAFGLAAADGVMRYLEEQGVGYDTHVGFKVPIVPAAVLFDLPMGESGIRPDAAMGYAACQNASDSPTPQGSVGAGTGCRIGAMLGNEYATKGGIGSACIDLGDGLYVAALVAVNALGDVVDESGNIIAGLRMPPAGTAFADSLNMIKMQARVSAVNSGSGNTVIGVVATNAKLTKEEINKVAQMAHDGLARAVRPAHTMFDGDTLFALATGEIPANVNAIGVFAAEATAQAIRNGVKAAAPLSGVRNWQGER